MLLALNIGNTNVTFGGYDSVVPVLTSRMREAL